MIKDNEQFIAWFDRNTKRRGDKKEMYAKLAQLTGTPYHTVRNWHQLTIKPNHAALQIINQAIKSGELPL